MLPDSLKQEIADRTDIVEYIGRFVSLKKAGSRWRGLCPFHADKDPSFHVNPDRGFYYCFGCGAGGDIFTFVMQHEKMDFPDALRHLAAWNNIPVDEGRPGQPVPRRARIWSANAAAADWFRERLKGQEGTAARDYLKRRGVIPPVEASFRIGYAPPGWDGLLTALTDRGFSGEELEEAGLVIRGTRGWYDRFRDRIVFPIVTTADKVAGFGGRLMGPDKEQPKYLNSPETPAYRKSAVLFGLNLAREAIGRHGRVIVTEGYFDVTSMHQAGMAETVAPCGTALTDEQAAGLKRYTERVVLLFDGDPAGKKAAMKALEPMLRHGFDVRLAVIPGGDDPDSLLAAGGRERLVGLVEDARPMLEVLIEGYFRAGRSDPRAVSRRVDRLLDYLRLIESGVERELWLRRLAGAAGLSFESVAERLTRRQAAMDPVREARPAGRPARSSDLPRAALAVLTISVLFPALREKVRQSDAARWLGSGPAARELQAVLEAPEEATPGELVATVTETGLRDALMRSLAEGDEYTGQNAPLALNDALMKLQIDFLKKELTDLDDFERKRELALEIRKLEELRRGR